MNAVQTTVYNMIRAYFRVRNIPTHSEILTKTKQISESLFSGDITEREIKEIVEEYETNIGVKAFDPDTLVSTNANSQWFKDKKNQNWRQHLYWNRYEEYLRNEKNFDESTIQVLKRSTEEILGYCANPTPQINEVKKRKGLVVGDVQSGKTANYMALINMACDYDYKLIIVLAGLTDSLRKQTQERVDEGFIGAISNTIGSSNVKYIGVGLERKQHYGVTLTNLDRDFRRESMNALNNLTGDYNKPVVLVVKKNKSTLENVKEFLQPNAIGSIDHILIIDDEADNASVNTKKGDDDPSAINALIRDLYNNFPNASYVGYTATPFANIFINPDDDQSYKDLFPSDFITLLKTPTSYFGYEKVFGSDHKGNTRYIRIIDENEPFFLRVNHKKDDSYDGISPSLKEAIQLYFINNVIRTLRGKPYAHRSMMINISRFNNMQNNIKNKVVAYVENLKNIIIQTSYMHKDSFLRNVEMLEMYNFFMTSNYYDSIRQDYPWELIQEHLSYEAERMKVIVVNRLKDEEKIDYSSLKEIGARYIVIGGFVLSRGLTLEGLMVSYYSRNGSAYDSLLQMCRWFGYRPNYEDLCRIYMSEINVESFGAVIDATDDLKEQFRNMKAHNKTPNDFGLMVKRCPDILNTLLITSRNKSRNTIDKEIVLNYSCQSIDTSKIFKDKEKNKHNLKVLRDEVENKLNNLELFNGRYMYRNVNKDIIINVLRKFLIHENNRKFDITSICNFLENSDTLNLWNIVVATGSDGGKKTFEFGGITTKCIERSFENREEDSFIRIAGNNNRVLDPGIFNSGLDQDIVNEIRSRNTNPSAKDYLRYQRNPILVILPICLLNKNNDLDKQRIIDELEDDVVMGLGIGFPYNGDEIIVKYKLNVRKQQELEREREMMEDEDDD